MKSHKENSKNHILRELVFPARYEQLIDEVGPEFARLLVAPPNSTLNIIETITESIKARGEGLFCPILALSGTGKTTLAHSLRTFFPAHFSETVDHTGEVSYDSLNATIKYAKGRIAADDERVIPINIDHREGNPATGVEIANIKRLLRDSGGGNRTLLLWPETTEEIAKEMADGYVRVAGRSPVDLPVLIDGPTRDSWPGIAKNTLEVSNDVESLELLGVNPNDYAASEFHSIGDYLRQISDDFTRRRIRILQETRRPIHLIVAIASESSDAGVLSQLTNSSRFGLADASALLDATKTSEVGRWWMERRGLLTQMNLQLDVRLFGIPPSLSIPILRQYGPEDVTRNLIDLGIEQSGPYSINRKFSRSDFGKYIDGTANPTFENRGTPSRVSLPAFSLLADVGFTAGRDKLLNKSVLKAVEGYLNSQGRDCSNFKAEKSLEFTPLIPDISFDLEGDTYCVELTWRRGEFLTSTNRASIAAYVLKKMQNYARELGHA
ncbi:hypothetical protein [Nocardiopsis sp. MG754419]|uniref:hypothetical protein n=1 Tax=Nocardiopsis sp. MG754419 TaxID=2259865 RepID=UPI001BA4C62F|nr:hypothetical protein [Nocardiopsis sp. MG754419]